MKKDELKIYYQKKGEDLLKELSSLKAEYDKVRMNITVGREKNLKKAKNINKKIAQIKTLLKYKQMIESVSNK